MDNAYTIGVNDFLSGPDRYHLLRMFRRYNLRSSTDNADYMFRSTFLATESACACSCYSSLDVRTKKCTFSA